ncbi:MAG TPA: AraC family transcriptional regulator, partial [Pseudomonas sp.]|nr:AraC family transcriptional regulator [Pseudomonas sp.]
LLKQTPMSIIEVASVCGFVSTPHFSKCYREFFGIPPRDERSGQQSAQVVALIPRPGEASRNPATVAALQRA